MNFFVWLVFRISPIQTFNYLYPLQRNSIEFPPRRIGQCPENFQCDPELSIQFIISVACNVARPVFIERVMKQQMKMEIPRNGKENIWFWLPKSVHFRLLVLQRGIHWLHKERFICQHYPFYFLPFKLFFRRSETEDSVNIFFWLRRGLGGK